MPQVENHTIASTVEMIGILAFETKTRDLETRNGHRTLAYNKITLPATVERDGVRQPTTDFRFADSVEVQDWGSHADKSSREGSTLQDFTQGDPVRIVGRLSESRWKTGEGDKASWNSKLRVEVLEIEPIGQAELRELLMHLA